MVWPYSACAAVKRRVFVACSRKSILRERGKVAVVVEVAFLLPL